jgi:hypothetical protein
MSAFGVKRTSGGAVRTIRPAASVLERRRPACDVDIPQGGAEGMIVTQGGRFGGYGFYVLKGKPVFLYNFLDFKRTRWEAPDALTPGKHTLEFDFKYDGLGAATLAFNNVSGIGRGGTGVLKVDGKEVARQTMEHTIPLIMRWECNGTRTLTSVPTLAHLYQTITRCHSSSPGSSTS